MRCVEPAQHLRQQAIGGRVERERQSRTARGDVGGELGAAGLPEPDRLCIAVMHGRDVAEGDRFFDALQFRRRQRLEKTAQTEALEIHRQIATVAAS